MANFEAFRWNISSSINLFFLKSALNLPASTDAVDEAKSQPSAAVQFENNKQWAFIFCKFITYSYVCTGVGTSTSVAIRISKS